MEKASLRGNISQCTLKKKFEEGGGVGVRAMESFRSEYCPAAGSCKHGKRREIC